VRSELYFSVRPYCSTLIFKFQRAMYTTEPPFYFTAGTPLFAPPAPVGGTETGRAAAASSCFSHGPPAPLCQGEGHVVLYGDELNSLLYRCNVGSTGRSTLEWAHMPRR